MCFVPVEAPPEVLFSAVKVPGASSTGPAASGIAPGSDGVILFSELIVEAATECGKLQDLAEVAKSAVNSPDTADTFSLLTAAAAEHDPHLTQQATEYVATLQQQAQATGQVRLKPWPVCRRSGVDAKRDSSQPGEALGKLLAAHATGTQQRSFVSYLHRDLATCRVQQSGGTLAAGADPGLALWHPSGYYFTSGSQAGTWPGWWVERDGMILHLSGPEVSPLYFDCPLAGNFELTVDGYWVPARRRQSSTAGAVRAVWAWRQGTDADHWRGESVERPDPKSIPDRFNRLVIRVSPEKVSYLCNGVLVFEDLQPSSATPSLALLGRCTRPTASCNLQRTGDPQVLHEVSLIQGDRMEGWMSPIYRENVPKQLSSSESGSAPHQDRLPHKATSGTPPTACSTAQSQNHPIETWPSSHGWPITVRCAVATR